MALAKAQDATQTIVQKSVRKAETVWEKATLVWCFPWSLNHFYNLVRDLTKWHRDFQIKKPEEIPGYLEKENILFRKTQRNHLDYLKVKEDFLRET